MNYATLKRSHAAGFTDPTLMLITVLYELKYNKHEMEIHSYKPSQELRSKIIQTLGRQYNLSREDKGLDRIF